MKIKQFKHLIIALFIGIILGVTVTYIYDQSQNVTVSDDEDLLNVPETVQDFTFTNYNIYVDKTTTTIIGEIKNNSLQKRKARFTLDLIDYDGETLGTSKEISMNIGAGRSKPFLAVIDKPIDDYIDITFNVITE